MKRTTAIFLIAALLGSACILSSCTKKEKTIVGAVAGTAVGAGVGSALGNTEGAVAGGILGALTGGLIGHSLGDDKKEMKYNNNKYRNKNYK